MFFKCSDGKYIQARLVEGFYISSYVRNSFLTFDFVRNTRSIKFETLEEAQDELDRFLEFGDPP